MSRKLTKRGMVLPLALVAILAVMGLVATIGSLNQGLRTQIFRTNNYQLSFLIAYSAFSRVCAKIHSFSWANRPFLNEPYTETKVPLQGGHYDLLVENTVGKDYQADIYIRTNLAGISRMYFWRIRVNDDLLDISNNIIVELYTTPEVEDYPTINGPRTIAGKVEDMLMQRIDNQKKSDQLASELMTITNTKSIIEKLGARVPDDFQQEWPASVTDEIMEARGAIQPSDLQIPPEEEKPDVSGPRSGFALVGSDDYQSGSSSRLPSDSMSGNQIARLSTALTSASEELVAVTDKAWNAIDANGVVGIPAATEQWGAADESKKSIYAKLDGLIVESKNGIAEAPSTRTQVAIEEMVAQTVVSSMNDVTTSISRGFDHLATGDGSLLQGLSTSSSAESLLNAWKTAETGAKADLDKLTAVSSKIQNYTMAPEVAQELTATLASARDSLEEIQAAVAAAEARLAKLLEEEAAAAAAAAGGTGTAP